MGKRLVIILGPTCVGKTGFAIESALSLGSPVISCDSRQIYKEMSIGTAVPSPQELSAVKHYFIGTGTIHSPYSAGRYENEAVPLVESLFAGGHDSLVMTGGSMLYIDAVCGALDSLPEADPSVRAGLMDRLAEEGLPSLLGELARLDPATAASIEKDNPHRVVRALEVCLSTGRPFSSFKTGTPKPRPFRIVKIGLRRKRDELYDRINARVDSMISSGLVEEARGLYPFRSLQPLKTVGYQELFAHFDGLCALDKAVEDIKTATRHYAKRQLTWWRRDRDIEWIDL